MMASSFFTEDGFNEIFQKAKSKPILKSARESFEHYRETSEAHSFEDSALELGPQNEYVIQGSLRPWFDKQGINTGGIAQHPDFSSLAVNNTTVNQYVSTLFIDIKGSTRLSLLYDLEFIYHFKNAVLQTCIEIVRSFDGYVHRLMGDALMAFFGSKAIDKEQAAIDSINCSLMCKLMLENAIKPWLSRQDGFDSSSFGFRVGCNFGDDHEILWGNYGFGLLGEVSPTGLPVDLAAKLQNLANKNEIMIGQGIIDFIHWPEAYSAVKKENRKGVEIPINFITPNYIKKDGSNLDYSMRLLDYKACLEYLPISSSVKSNLNGLKYIDNSSIKFTCQVQDANGEWENYISGTRFLEKNLALVFNVEAVTASRLKFPLAVIFTKRNHGPGVPSDELEEIIKKDTIKKSKDNPFSRCSLDEGTSYRGLHTMGCDVRDSDGLLIYRNKIAVLIK
jgi:adenylate cyclase